MISSLNIKSIGNKLKSFVKASFRTSCSSAPKWWIKVNISVGTRSNSVWLFFVFSSFFPDIFLYIRNWESNFEQNEYLNGYHFIKFEKIMDKKRLPTGLTDRTGWKWLFVCFFIKINMMIATKVFILFKIWFSIHVWNRISKNSYIWKKLEKTKNSQTEFDRVPTLVKISPEKSRPRNFEKKIAKISSYQKIQHLKISKNNPLEKQPYSQKKKRSRNDFRTIFFKILWFF
jgi:hypothetical protein